MSTLHPGFIARATHETSHFWRRSGRGRRGRPTSGRTRGVVLEPAVGARNAVPVRALEVVADGVKRVPMADDADGVDHVVLREHERRASPRTSGGSGRRRDRAACAGTLAAARRRRPFARRAAGGGTRCLIELARRRARRPTRGATRAIDDARERVLERALGEHAGHARIGKGNGFDFRYLPCVYLEGEWGPRSSLRRGAKLRSEERPTRARTRPLAKASTRDVDSRAVSGNRFATELARDASLRRRHARKGVSDRPIDLNDRVRGRRSARKNVTFVSNN